MLLQHRIINAVWLTVNRACDNRCDWCYAKETCFSVKDDMSLDMVKKLVAMCSDMHIEQVLLIGGEPSIYPHLEETVSLCVQNGISPHLISNGRHFSDRSFTEKMKALDVGGVSVSIKGASREQYQKLTHADGYQEMVDGVFELKRANIRHSLSITLTESMMKNPVELAECVARLEPKELFVEFANPIISNGESMSKEVPHPLKIAGYCEDLYDLFEEREINYLFNVGVPLCFFKDSFLEKLKEKKRVMSVCHARSGSGIIFLQNGDVIPCHQFLGNILGEYGADYTNAQEFLEFWNGPKHRTLTNAFNRFPSETCSKCDDWKMCGGGCMMRWLVFDPAVIKNTYEKRQAKRR